MYNYYPLTDQSIAGFYLYAETRPDFYARRVASQHSSEPAQTISAPCQNENDSGALSNTAASAEESTGVK